MILVVGTVVAVESQDAYTPLWAFQPPPQAEASAEKAWIPLADGSTVSPGDSSEWAVNLQSEAEVQLELTQGTLELRVESDSKREFSVVMGAVRVIVVGTRFRADRGPSEIGIRHRRNSTR